MQQRVLLLLVGSILWLSLLNASPLPRAGPDIAPTLFYQQVDKIYLPRVRDHSGGTTIETTFFRRSPLPLPIESGSSKKSLKSRLLGKLGVSSKKGSKTAAHQASTSAGEFSEGESRHMLGNYFYGPNWKPQERSAKQESHASPDLHHPQVLFQRHSSQEGPLHTEISTPPLLDHPHRQSTSLQSANEALKDGPVAQNSGILKNTGDAEKSSPNRRVQWKPDDQLAKVLNKPAPSTVHEMNKASSKASMRSKTWDGQSREGDPFRWKHIGVEPLDDGPLVDARKTARQNIFHAKKKSNGETMNSEGVKLKTDHSKGKKKVDESEVKPSQSSSREASPLSDVPSTSTAPQTSPFLPEDSQKAASSHSSRQSPQQQLQEPISPIKSPDLNQSPSPPIKNRWNPFSAIKKKVGRILTVEQQPPIVDPMKETPYNQKLSKSPSLQERIKRVTSKNRQPANNEWWMSESHVRVKAENKGTTAEQLVKDMNWKVKPDPAIRPMPSPDENRAVGFDSPLKSKLSRPSSPWTHAFPVQEEETASSGSKSASPDPSPLHGTLSSSNEPSSSPQITSTSTHPHTHSHGPSRSEITEVESSPDSHYSTPPVAFSPSPLYTTITVPEYVSPPKDLTWKSLGKKFKQAMTPSPNRHSSKKYTPRRSPKHLDPLESEYGDSQYQQQLREWAVRMEKKRADLRQEGEGRESPSQRHEQKSSGVESGMRESPPHESRPQWMKDIWTPELKAAEERPREAQDLSSSENESVKSVDANKEKKKKRWPWSRSQNKEEGPSTPFRPNPTCLNGCTGLLPKLF